MAAVGMKSKRHALLATIAGVQALEADGTYQPQSSKPRPEWSP